MFTTIYFSLRQLIFFQDQESSGPGSQNGPTDHKNMVEQSGSVVDWSNYRVAQ